MTMGKVLSPDAEDIIYIVHICNYFNKLSVLAE